MRWKIELAYLGTHYAGWQRQPNDRSVQQVVEEAFSTILRQDIELVGCGRTDAGVHARQYVAHFDAGPISQPEKTVYQVNAILPPDIAVHHLDQVHDAFHARYDAVARQYKYYMHGQKDPFLDHQSLYFHYHVELDREAMHAAAALLLQYNHFKPFCLTGSDARHFTCRIDHSEWVFDQGKAVYSIQANRFLRGMVRLIVGACLNAGLNKIKPDDLRKSLDEQSAVPHAWSVPAHGLFLERVDYPG